MQRYRIEGDVDWGRLRERAARAAFTAGWLAVNLAIGLLAFVGACTVIGRWWP